MKHYWRYGFGEFVLALGYKGEYIKNYFLNYRVLGGDFTISLEDGGIQRLGDSPIEPWRVHLVDTGQNSLTGGRLKRIEKQIGSGTFMLTYGDGVGNVPIDELLAFHRSHGKLVTLTAVRSPARFGGLQFDGERVTRFKEKSTLDEGWINGGFFVVEPEALRYIEGDVPWENDPLERLAIDGELFAYQHEGFWQCMDTVRDHRYLESLWHAEQAPWKTW